MFADAWLSSWLAEISADLRETVVVLHDYALYKSTFTLLLYCMVKSFFWPVYTFKVFVVLLFVFLSLVVNKDHQFANYWRDI